MFTCANICCCQFVRSETSAKKLLQKFPVLQYRSAELENFDLTMIWWAVIIFFSRSYIPGFQNHIMFYSLTNHLKSILHIFSLSCIVALKNILSFFKKTNQNRHPIYF